jgi:hypothetical protein
VARRKKGRKRRVYSARAAYHYVKKRVKVRAKKRKTYARKRRKKR